MNKSNSQSVSRSIHQSIIVSGTSFCGSHFAGKDRMKCRKAVRPHKKVYNAVPITQVGSLLYSCLLEKWPLNWCVFVDNTISDTAYVATPWVWAVPSSWYKRIIWVISWPLIGVMFMTVPDCRQQRWRRWFIVTFVTSILWIGVYSYLMVWMIAVVGMSAFVCLVYPCILVIILSIVIAIVLYYAKRQQNSNTQYKHISALSIDDLEVPAVNT